MPNYAIGLTSGAPVYLQQAPVGTVPDPYPVEFQSYTEIIDTDSLGAPIEAGPAQVVWRWEEPGLRQSWFNWLYSFLEGKAYNTVYIRTSIHTGSDFTFALYQATMWRPTAETRPGPLRANVEIKFTKLVQLA